MGSETPRSRERHRTYWTPAMERYFVDMMLEHMQKGNRSGHTFSKQAWNDMLADFNTKFGSQYDKDVLKTRYTSLWKQFNDVKNMLGHGGFSWDATRHMVVADDYVWETYVKAHPDTRSYKTKAVQNFSDLCLIYGYTTADGRYSRSSHDMDVDDEIHALNLGDGLGSPTPSTADRSKTDWTLAMDQYFAELLFEQREKGNKLDNSYTKEAWTEMLNLFNAKFGCHHNKRGLRHRYKKLLKYYTDIMVLLKQDGFSWDEKELMVVANDDVWETYIQVHPQARAYRTISMPSYKDLELIFGSDIIDESSNLLDKCPDDDGFMGLRLGAPRTHWTPPMDRYLVDLLVVQVNKGNRNGKSFVAQAWLDMIRSFNSNFGIRRDKDVLKNRYKQLKRQFDDMTTILGQKGFYWDDKREMVVAKDHVWDAYIEAQPDARSYRDKTLPNYHKLCTIYDLDSSKRQYISLARKVSPDVAAVSSIDECSSSQLFLEAKNKWTSEMDECFIELMLEHYKGFKIDHGFDDEIWSVIIPSFNERCKLQYEKRDLQDRLSYFMKQFNEVESLITRDGFSWDATCQMVKASDESWEACSKEHPFATAYKGTVLRHHKDLSKIFGGSYSEKLKAYVDTPKVKKTVKKETETSNKRKRLKKTPISSGRGGKVPKNKNDDMKEAFTDMANVVSKLVNNKPDKNNGVIEKAVDALQAIPDIDDELLLDGCDILEDEKKAKTFLALDASYRKKWLLRKLGRTV